MLHTLAPQILHCSYHSDGSGSDSVFGHRLYLCTLVCLTGHNTPMGDSNTQHCRRGCCGNSWRAWKEDSVQGGCCGTTLVTACPVLPGSEPQRAEPIAAAWEIHTSCGLPACSCCLQSSLVLPVYLPGMLSPALTRTDVLQGYASSRCLLMRLDTLFPALI